MEGRGGNILDGLVVCFRLSLRQVETLRVKRRTRLFHGVTMPPLLFLPYSLKRTHMQPEPAHHGLSKVAAGMTVRLAHASSLRIPISLTSHFAKNDPPRVGLVGSGNGFAEDNVNDISLREHTRDLDHDPEGQHRGGIRQGKRRTADSERPQSIVFREDNMQRRTPGADNAGVLGAQDADGILYSITPVDNSRPPHRQSASTRDEMDDGVRQNRTSGTRLSRTSRIHIDDLVPVITVSIHASINCYKTTEFS